MVYICLRIHIRYHHRAACKTCRTVGAKVHALAFVRESHQTISNILHPLRPHRREPLAMLGWLGNMAKTHIIQSNVEYQKVQATVHGAECPETETLRKTEIGWLRSNSSYRSHMSFISRANCVHNNWEEYAESNGKQIRYLHCTVVVGICNEWIVYYRDTNQAVSHPTSACSRRSTAINSNYKVYLFAHTIALFRARKTRRRELHCMRSNAKQHSHYYIKNKSHTHSVH